MPRRDPSAYVWDVRDACQRIRAATDGLDFERYRLDDIRRAAVERWLIIIGEAMLKLTETDESMAAELGPAGAIIGFRNVLVHGYDAVNQSKVWEIITVHVPPLHEAAERVWARFAPLYRDDQPS